MIRMKEGGPVVEKVLGLDLKRGVVAVVLTKAKPAAAGAAGGAAGATVGAAGATAGAKRPESWIEIVKISDLETDSDRGLTADLKFRAKVVLDESGRRR
jgi:hypothetical protein